MVAKFSGDPGLRIRLKQNDKVLHEIRAGEISAEIEIGRSSSCGWRVPHEDNLISSAHAVLAREGRVVVLRDKGSTNGTWFQGKRIKERKLKAGDCITLGHCVLTVEQQACRSLIHVSCEMLRLPGTFDRDCVPGPPAPRHLPSCRVGRRRSSEHAGRPW